MKRRFGEEDLKAFDFKEEDNSCEFVAQKELQKYSSFNKKHLPIRKGNEDNSSPLQKYQFLKTFSSRAGSEGKKMSSISFIDVETSSGHFNCKDQHPQTTSPFDGVDCSIKGTNSGSDDIPVSCSISERDAVHTSPDSVVDGNIFSGCLGINAFETVCCSENPNPNATGPSCENDQINCNDSELLAKNNQVDVLSDEDESPTCSSDAREDCIEDSSSDHYSDGGEMDNMDVGVDVGPDYLIYKGMYCTDSLLCFLCGCVKLEGENAYGNKEAFSFEWNSTDVIGIESQWFAGTETALVRLLIKSDAVLDNKNPDGTSEMAELKFAVSDPNWFQIQAKIISMDARYEDIWRVLLDADVNEEATSAGMHQMGESKSYLPIFNEQFEDVIYPKGDPDAVSISKRDVELLQPETFVNDTIIDFYIKYLKNEMSPEDERRFHFFNSFFFRKLADLDKNPSSASEGRAAFLRVRKWTRKVNLFEKDYVFIPVNFNLHWSLIVICHPGEVPTFKDEEVDIALKVPCILHMDSIKGSHRGLKNLIQSYLWEEWKERHPDHEPSDDLSSKFSNLRFVPLELPQQENSFDCGLFLLHYVQQFLEDAPNHFNPSAITKFSNFLNVNWFEPSEASLKRVFIQKLISQLLKERPKEILENNNVKESGIEFFPNEQVPPNPCNGFHSNDDGIQIKLLGNPDPGHQYIGNSGLELKEFFETGTTSDTGSFPNGPQNGTFDRIMSFNTAEGDEYGVGGYNMYDPFLSSSIQQGQNEDEYVSCDVSSNCGSQSSLEEGMVEDDDKVPGTQEEFRLGSPENNNLSDSELSEDTRVVEDSQDVDDSEKRSFMVDDSENRSFMSDDGEKRSFMEVTDEDLGLDEHELKRIRVEEIED